MSLHDVEMAQRRDLSPELKRLIPAQPEDTVVVCDVARFGDDETVIGVPSAGRARGDAGHGGLCGPRRAALVLGGFGRGVVEDEWRDHYRVVIDAALSDAVEAV